MKTESIDYYVYQHIDWHNKIKQLALAMPLLFAQQAFANNDNSCERYANESIRQNDENEALNAGFKYPTWSSNFNHHYDWCRVGNNALSTSWWVAEREKALQEHVIKTNQRPCERYAREAVRQYHASKTYGSLEFSPPVFSENYYGHMTWCQDDNTKEAVAETSFREQKLQDYAVKYNLYDDFDASFTMDFEEGFLRGWTATGNAFLHQPTRGDNPTARLRGQPAKHNGKYWIGTYEKFQQRNGQRPGAIQGDSPIGTLTSPFFEIGSEISFLIGGGGGPNTRVELLVDGQVVRKAHGKNTETMHRVTWNVDEYAFETGQIHIVDNESGGWGHINVDDINIIPKITETMTDRCSSQVSLVPWFGGSPNARGTLTLKRGHNGETGWTKPFNVGLSQKGRIRWWCNSTTGNWADPGTWRFTASGFDTKCAIDLVSTAISKGSAGKLCFPVKGLKFGSSASNGWTPERSRCSDRSSKIRARLGKGRLLQIQCLGD